MWSFLMKFPVLQAATAIALLMGGTAAYAQGQPKSEEGKSSPQALPTDQGTPKGESQTQQKKTTEPKDKMGKGSAQTEPKDKASKGSQAEPKGKGTAQGESKEQPGKGTAQTEPKDKASNEKAQTEPKEKATKGTAGTDKGTAPAPKASESTKGATPKDSTAAAPSSGQRVQLSEQQRTTVHQTLLKERQVNRVTNVKFSINVGTRVPRDVRLEVLPASIIAIVSAYRSYRYFVVNDQICIVDPNTYEIVEVITVSGQTAARGDDRGSARLVLTDEERTIILREIDMSGGSTLGLGSLTEGADVPRNVEVRVFPETIVQKVSKVKGYKFFTVENRIAIVDPQGSKVQLVIEGRR
jgi:hypothetical protein